MLQLMEIDQSLRVGKRNGVQFLLISSVHPTPLTLLLEFSRLPFRVNPAPFLSSHPSGIQIRKPGSIRRSI